MSPEPTEALAATYAAIAEWLLYPEEIDPAAVDASAAAAAEDAARRVDLRAAEHLRAFWEERDSVGPEAYLELLELNPRCPLYLGSYQFPEPTTCAAAGVSDRNQYMLEIGNVYRHFGYEIAGELPDYLPAMIEFLALSCGSHGADAALRKRFIGRLMLPGTRLFAERLGELGTVYHRLAQALLLCLERETPDRDAEPAEPAVEPEPAEPADRHAKVLKID